MSYCTFPTDSPLTKLDSVVFASIYRLVLLFEHSTVRDVTCKFRFSIIRIQIPPKDYTTSMIRLYFEILQSPFLAWIAENASVSRVQLWYCTMVCH